MSKQSKHNKHDCSSWEEVIQHIKGAKIELHRLYNEMGVTEEYKTIFDQQAFTHIIDLLNDMVDEWEQKKQSTLSDIKLLMEQAVTLCKELGTENSTDGCENLPLKEIEKKLSLQVKSLLSLKEQRIAYFRELQNQEFAVCVKLGINPTNFESQVPSEKELEQFKLYINGIEAEKNRAKSTANELRYSIVKNMDLLGIQPSTAFEALVYNNYEDFVFSANNLSNLRKLRNELDAAVEAKKHEVDVMKNDLLALWKHLGEPEDECKSFLESYSDFSVNTVNALKSEIKRCKEKRMENIANYIDKVREEIVELWTACKFGEEQKKEFRAYNAQTYTEDLLTLHELEAERLRNFYEDNAEIYEVLNKRDALWTKMKEMQQRADDPDRFHNRGGQLLLEEKERKIIQKKLPKIEEKLRKLVQAYESKAHEPFTIYGMALEEFLVQSWESYKVEREAMKKARKEAKEANKMSKKTPLSTSKKLHSVSTRNTPLSTSKRKLLYDPSPNRSVKRRIVNQAAEKNHPTLLVSKIRRSDKVSRRLINRSLNKSGKKKRSISEGENSASANTTYGKFQEHLVQFDELRSSLLLENDSALMNVTEKRAQTPAKPLRKNLTTATPKGTPKIPRTLMLKNTSTCTTPTTSSRIPSATHKSPRSPKNVQSNRLVTAPNNLPIIF